MKITKESMEKIIVRYRDSKSPFPGRITGIYYVKAGSVDYSDFSASKANAREAREAQYEKDVFEEFMDAATRD